jgi:hypothetical protein
MIEDGARAASAPKLDLDHGVLAPKRDLDHSPVNTVLASSSQAQWERIPGQWMENDHVSGLNPRAMDEGGMARAFR